jgi:hypothetical protein
MTGIETGTTQTHWALRNTQKALLGVDAYTKLYTPAEAAEIDLDGDDYWDFADHSEHGAPAIATVTSDDANFEILVNIRFMLECMDQANIRSLDLNSSQWKNTLDGMIEYLNIQKHPGVRSLFDYLEKASKKADIGFEVEIDDEVLEAYVAERLGNEPETGMKL